MPCTRNWTYYIWNKQQRPFELVRSNSKDVEIITFDELLGKIENIQKLTDYVEEVWLNKIF